MADATSNLGNADNFLKLDGIDGESQDSKHSNEIEISEFAFDVANAYSGQTGGGSGAGVSVHGDVHFRKTVDKSSAKLMQAAASGEHIKKAVLSVRKAGKDQQDYLKYTFSDVFLTNYHMGGVDTRSGLPLDTFDMTYGKAQIEYKEQKPDGTLGGAVSAGWDVKARKVV